MEALLRRFRAIAVDQLVVSKRPARRALGEYELRRRADRSRARPYVTRLEAVAPLRGVCSCPDFLRGSLGACKHLLCVLELLAAKPSRWERAQKERLPVPPIRFRFDPYRPLAGPAPRTSQIRLVADSSPPWLRDVLQWFVPSSTRGELVFEPGSDRLRAFEALARCLESSFYRAADPAPDAALLAVVAEERHRAAQSETPGRLASKLDGHLSSLGYELYAYQREGVRRFLSQSRLLLADDMGLGKTAQAIASAHVLVRGRLVSRGLVVCPASLRTQWAREWHKLSDVPVEIVDGSPNERLQRYSSWDTGFLILGYETLLRDLGALMSLGAELVILDEAQRIKNWQTQTARAVKRLDVPYRLVLTGTPLENRIDELASIMDWVDDRALEPKWRLAPYHLEAVGDAADGHSGSRHLETLRARLEGPLLRRARSEVLHQLPGRTDNRVPVTMTPRQLAEHEELRIPIAALIHRAKARPLSPQEFLKLMKLLNEQRIISNGLAQRDFEEVWPDLETRPPAPSVIDGLNSPKLVELRSLVESLISVQDRKVVVFSQWRRMLRLAHWSLRDILETGGTRVAFFTGAESIRLRDKGVVAFHDDPRTRIMFLSDAGGVGLNLQHAASACINLDLPWNPAVLEQRVGRIHRNGQTKPIDVFNLVAEAGIEGHIERLLGTKKALFASIFESESNEVRFDAGSSFAESLSELIGVSDSSDEEEVVLEQEAELLEEAVERADGSAPLEADEMMEAGAEGVVPVATAVQHAVPEASGDRRAASNGGAHPADDLPRSHPAGDARGSSELSAASALGMLRVERTGEGGLRIEAPREAAEVLAGMFEAFGALLRSGARP